MNLLKRVFIAALLTAYCCYSEAQITMLPPPEANENLLKGRVKQIDEFMARFNMYEAWDGSKITDRKDSTFRKKYLATLFDDKKFKLPNGNLNALAAEFVDYVVNKDYQLKYEDSLWSAEVKCSIKIGYQHKIMRLFLRTFKVREGEYKWVISNAVSDIFNVAVSDSSSNAFISPVEHEIGFVGLISSCNNTRNVSGYFDSHVYFPDNLSMLAVLLGNGLLKIESVENVLFHFQTVSGYSFTIERVEKRGSYNTGWLITRLTKF